MGNIPDNGWSVKDASRGLALAERMPMAGGSAGPAASLASAT